MVAKHPLDFIERASDPYKLQTKFVVLEYGRRNPAEAAFLIKLREVIPIDLGLDDEFFKSLVKRKVTSFVANTMAKLSISCIMEYIKVIS